MKFTIGKGKTETEYHVSFGMQIAVLDEQKMESMSFKKFAKELAKQMEIKDGEITLHSVNFSYEVHKRDETKK